MIVFRNCDRRYPFFWEIEHQPAMRWNGPGEGPVQYVADTPDGAWAEFLRHEDIVDEIDLVGVKRSLWAIEVDIGNLDTPQLSNDTMTGGPATYPACQDEARRLRDLGSPGLVAPSAALAAGSAAGYRVRAGFQEGEPRDGEVYVLFGRRPDAVGWPVVDEGRPPAEILGRVRHFS